MMPQCNKEKKRFQSTPSQEGEPPQTSVFDPVLCISIHSLARGRTSFPLLLRLRGQFQSTPSQEGERTPTLLLTARHKFQSTPSQEGEHLGRNSHRVKLAISIHSLARGRTDCHNFPSLPMIFQSTPSQEGEHQRDMAYRIYVCISIHSLARGRTAETIDRGFGGGISIHSLARGRTAEPPIYNEPTRFQSTPSQEGEHLNHNYPQLCITISIHSLARGRTSDIISICFNAIDISIHSLARGRTTEADRKMKSLTFQSTPSQEGEHFIPPFSQYKHRISIHSLARGRTFRILFVFNIIFNFNPLPRKRENNWWVIIYTNLLHFNPLPRKRENYPVAPNKTVMLIFQSTPSQEGELQNVTISDDLCREFM